MVLLDLRMPVLDGYAVATEVRQGQLPANRDVLIVAYSSEPAHVASVKAQRAARLCQQALCATAAGGSGRARTMRLLVDATAL